MPLLAMTPLLEMQTIMTDFPDGFERHTRSSPLTEPWEPIYAPNAPTARSFSACGWQHRTPIRAAWCMAD